MGCTFCATGTMGIRGNLCAGEILEQLVHGSRILAEENGNENDDDDDGNNQHCGKKKRMDMIRNVVFMGKSDIHLCGIFIFGPYFLHLSPFTNIFP